MKLLRNGPTKQSSNDSDCIDVEQIIFDYFTITPVFYFSIYVILIMNYKLWYKVLNTWSNMIYDRSILFLTLQ